ncbi:hypothetical protein D3C80_825470 [compost metagenome]
MLLSGSLFVPTLGKVGTFAHPLALLITQAEPILGVTITLLGGLFQPLNRIDICAGLTGIPLPQDQLSAGMIPFGSLLEPLETRAHQLILVLTLALLAKLIAGVPITQLGRTLPPVMGQPGVLGFTQTSLIPAPYLQRRFTANIGIRRQRPGLIRGLLHPAHRLWIIGLGSQTIGKLILRLALALLGGLR